MKFIEGKKKVSKSYLTRKEVWEGRKNFNSSSLGYPTRVKTMIILTENVECFFTSNDSQMPQTKIFDSSSFGGLKERGVQGVRSISLHN